MGYKQNDEELLILSLPHQNLMVHNSFLSIPLLSEKHGRLLWHLIRAIHSGLCRTTSSWSLVIRPTLWVLSAGHLVHTDRSHSIYKSSACLSTPSRPPLGPCQEDTETQHWEPLSCWEVGRAGHERLVTNIGEGKWWVCLYLFITQSTSKQLL